MNDTRDLIRHQLRLAGTQWNLGTFGAIAEFMRDPDEPVELTDEPGQLSAATSRGGIGFGDLSGTRLFASETALGRSWSHRVALCLPSDACAMNRRSVLTELGPDEAALRAPDRNGILFDIGLACLQTDICVRTTDPGLIATLRAGIGRPVFEPGNPAMPAILAAGPHRVFVARIGRCEVYQPIPPTDGTSPHGPHTHVLPKLLAHARTHAANEPVPEGFVPCAHLVPAHPVKDAMGRPRPWDETAHREFQHLLASYGDAEAVALKARALSLLEAGSAVGDLDMPASRQARQAVKVALRQHARGRQLIDDMQDGPGSTDEPDDAIENNAYGHG